MTTLAEHFPEVETMDIGALHECRNAIISSAPGGDTNNLDDESLAKLLAIGRALRKKAAVQGGAGRAKKQPATLDDLI